MNGSRRAWLLGWSGLSLGVVSGCQPGRRQVVSAERAYGVVPARAFPPIASAPAPVVAPVAASCPGVTEDNIEGPYYRPGAPRRADLREGQGGVALELQGCVRSADCRSALAGATIDVWHASPSGHYDNDHSGALDPQGFHFRGVVVADARGAYRVSTIVPGRYLNGRQYRPAHIHVKLSAPGHAPLTTQLYFPGDPFNDVDPFIKRSLLIDLEGDAHEKRGAYDFVLAPA